MIHARCMTLLVSLSISLPALAMASEVPGQSSVETATKAEEVVAAYLEAIGGADAVRAVRTRRIAYWVHMLGRDPYLMERSWTRPNRMRTGPPGADAHTLTEGEKSWRVGPEGQQELPPPVAQSLGKFADIDGPLVDSKSKGVTLTYSGLSRYDMTDLHQVTATFPDGGQWDFFFDAGSGLLRKTTHPSFKMSDGRFSRGADVHDFFYDYRAVGGVLYPHHWVQRTEDYTHLFVVETIETRK